MNFDYDELDELIKVHDEAFYICYETDTILTKIEENVRLAKRAGMAAVVLALLRKEWKSEIYDRLIEWAQNNEMIDNNYTDHGKDCLEAAKLLREFKRSNPDHEKDCLEAAKLLREFKRIQD
jgi:hypothetical protein